jgi:hypothetical protein
MPIDIRSGTGLVQNEGDVVRNYGLNLKNPDFKSRKRVVNDTVIKAGSSINLKGNEAQVAVKQLTDEILQREGKTRLMADPHLRHEVEERIIKYRGSIEELMNSNFQTPQNQINEAIKQSNEVHNEVAFPGLAEPTQGSRIPEPTEANTAINDPGQPKRVGRPKKENSPAN